MTNSLPTDPESYTELQQLCQDCGVTLGGAETITELIEILEPLIGDIVWQWKAQSYPAKILLKSENGDPT